MKKSFNTGKVYICLTLITLTACTAALLLSSGRLFQVFFFTDPNDTFMDFYNSMIESSTGKPFTDFNVLYPPLSNLFFYVLSCFIPEQIRSSWPMTHFEVQGLVGTAQDVRHNQSGLMIFLLVFLITLFIIAAMIHSMTKSYLMTFCLTFSSGLLSCLERGNVVLIAFLLTLVFIKYYNDPSPQKRELALIALAVAFGFKLYPAFFGLLLLKDRKYLAAIRSVIYALLFTLLPALIMGEADRIIPWLKMVLGRSAATTATVATNTTVSDTGSPFSVRLLILIIIMIVIIADLIMDNIKNSRFRSFLTESELIFLITTAMTVFSPTTNGYILIFYIIPFIFFLKEEPMITRYNLAEYLVYLAVLLPYGINNMSYPIMLLYALGIVIRRLGIIKKA